MAVSGLFLDSQIETKSGSSRSGGQLDPGSGIWSNEAANSFGHDVTNVRNSNGAGNYSHDRFGFEVSGAITVANENNYRMHHSTTHVYVDGNLTNLDWCHPLFVVRSAVMAASSANAARDAAFAEMAEETETIGDPEDPASQASADSLEAAAGMATYVEAQGSLPMPGNPAAVAAGATRQLNALNQTVLSELQNNSGRLTPENIQALIDYHRSQGTLYEVTSPGRSPKWGFAIPIVFPDGTTRYLIVEYISPGIFSGGRYVVAGVSPGSVDPRRAIEARITEPHQNSQLDNALRAFEFGMAMIPGLSDALDLGEAIFGYDWTTGDLLDAAGRMDALRAASFPGVIGLKNIETGSDLLNGLRKNPEVAPKGIANLSDELRICGDLARARLRSALGLVRGSADEAHHLIPVGLRDHDVVQRAARGGFNFNGVDNGVAITFDRHRGVNIFHHNKYNEAIRSRLERELLGTPNMTDAQAADFLRSYTEQLRNAINNTRGRLR